MVIPLVNSNTKRNLQESSQNASKLSIGSKGFETHKKTPFGVDGFDFKKSRLVNNDTSGNTPLRLDQKKGFAVVHFP